MAMDQISEEQGLRDLAIQRLKKQHNFRAHLLIYTLVNAFLVAIWVVTGHGFFWPIFPIVGWGIGVVMNAWDVYRSDEPTEERIRREMERIQHRD
jgi:hypothetical protein